VLLLATGACTQRVAVLTGPQPEQIAQARKDAIRKLVSGAEQLKGRSPKALERAEQDLGAAVKLDPTLWEAHYDLGLVARKRHDLALACEHFSHAATLAPDAPEPSLGQASCERERGNFDRAAGLLLAHLQKHPDDLGARLTLAAVHRERGKPEEAKSAVHDVLVAHADNIPALLEVGRIYVQTKELDVAELVLEKAKGLAPNDASVHNALGLVALERGDTQLAFTHFAKAQSLDARFVDAFVNQGAVLVRAGDYAAAERSYRSAVKNAPDRLDAHIGLGIALRGLARYKDAEQAYRQVLLVEPLHLAALFDLAVLKAAFMDQKAEALPLFEQVLSYAPPNTPQRADAQRYVEDIRMALGATK
jgi:tetratricopeptide (TPR) repeat protein